MEGQWKAADTQRRALTALRQRKFQEGLLTKTDSQLQTLQELVRPLIHSILCLSTFSPLLLLALFYPNLHHPTSCQLANTTQVSSIEFTQIQATVLHGLQIGNDVLKELHREVSLERVEKLMDKTRDGVEYQRVCHPYDPPSLDWS